MKILSKIKPSAKEQKEFNVVTTQFIRTLNKELQGAKAVLGGSGAKDTWLAGNHDVDVFVWYNYTKYSSKSSELSELLLPAIKKAFPKFKIKRMHGSRDYFQLQYKNHQFEIVPILHITDASQAKNITDVSMLHVGWVHKHAAKLKDEIRLAKQFCKAQRLYGAESYISGFSGYVLEILIVVYGSFEKLLQASLKWKIQVVLDPTHFYPKDPLFHLNKSKTRSPLVIIDPVDRSRNAAAALNVKKFQLFRTKARAFLKNSEGMFERQHFTKEFVKEKAKKNPFIRFTLTPQQGKRDVIGAKLLKVFTHLSRKLEPFNIVDASWDWQEGDDAVFYFIYKTKIRPEFEERVGPPVDKKEFVKEFKKRHKKTFIENGKIIAKVPIKYREFRGALQKELESSYVKEKVVRFKI